MMAVRFTKDRLMLYGATTVAFLIHWIHNDLATNPGQFAASLLNNTWQVVYVVGLNLLYFEFVLPELTSGKSNRVLSILFSIIVHLVVFAIGLYGWRVLGGLIHLYHPFKRFSQPGDAFSDVVRFTPGVFILFAVFKLFFEYTQLKYEGQQARLEKKQAELLYLKSQINPHFLFNTLNNIYSLAEYQPHLVAESILRLSQLLRYLLYEASSEFISLEQEVKILTDYIDLEKLRYSDQVRIDFSYEIDEPSSLIPPLLLLPLVENAFKHGISESRGKRFVQVLFTLCHHQLYFTVKNSSDSLSDNQELQEHIGLSNLKRRLSLLYNQFDFVTDQQASIFSAVLTIDLSSHV